MSPVEWRGTKINVLDAPGTADFVGDLRNAIRAADAVIVVVSAVDGVEVQTEYAWELAVDEGLPRAIFINKLDRERADFEATLAQLVSSFGNQVAPFELPIGAEQEFRGIADLLHEKADLYPSGPKAEESEWPDDLHAMADPAREKLIEAVAESDDALIEEYLETGSLPEEHIVVGRQGRLRAGAPGAGDLRIGGQGDRHRPAARLHRGGVPLPRRSRRDQAVRARATPSWSARRTRAGR